MNRIKVKIMESVMRGEELKISKQKKNKKSFRKRETEKKKQRKKIMLC
jgi:hypothetical protein